MNKLLVFLFFILLLSACNKSGIDDSDKRNQNWVWWVDSKTGAATWIPCANNTSVMTGNYTTFFFNGKMQEKGKLIDGKNIDTAYVYDINETLIKLYHGIN